MPTYVAYGVTRRTDTFYGYASRNRYGRVRFHVGYDAAATAAGMGGTVHTLTQPASAAKVKSWPAIECGRCGKLHTTLKCDGCGF